MSEEILPNSILVKVKFYAHLAGMSLKIKEGWIVAVLLVISDVCVGQGNANNFVRYYPIGEDPSICYKSSYVKNETILFEANPTVRYSFYNTISKGLSAGKRRTQAWYLEIRPQIRMYNDNSFPVKTPSYRFFIGTQHMYRLSDRYLIAASLQSGHYSNGQSNSAFSEKFADGSRESDSLYTLITPETNLSQMINRETGNFSTHLAEGILNFRTNRFNEKRVPYKTSSLKIGLIVYQRRFSGFIAFGGDSKRDINLYGKYRFLTGYEYVLTLKKGEGIRMSFSENIELIQGAHPSVNPLRTETIYTLYPFINTNTLGFFLSYAYGHDTYNLRFVDAGHQLALGITWCQFPPFQMKQMEKK